jgi:hypothetical protein
VLALDDRHPARGEAVAIVGRVQLAAEPQRPALRAAERRVLAREAIEQRQVAFAPDVRNPAQLSADLPDAIAREAYRE